MLFPGWKERLALSVCALLFVLVPVNRAQPQPPIVLNAKEVLEYAVEWRLVSAGRAKLSWTVFAHESKSRYEAKLHLESTGLVSRLFHVEDDYTADLTQNYCTESTFMTAHEAGRNRETKVVYDYKTKDASYRERDLVKNTVITAETEIPPCVRDVIGGLYHLRTLNLEPGKSIQVPVSNGKKVVMLKIDCLRREQIKTPLGPRQTLLCEIFAFNDVLYKRPGHLHVWLTDDSRKVPVQIQVRLQFTIGTITLRLDKEEKT